MGGSISLISRAGERKIWFTSNWVYRSFLDCVMQSCLDDAELFNQILRAKYLQSLSFEIIEKHNPVLKDRAFAAIHLGVKNIIEGKCPPASVEGRILDERSQKQYIESIEELAQLLMSDLP